MQLYGHNSYEDNYASNKGKELTQQLGTLLFICISNVLTMPFPLYRCSTCL